MDKEAEELIADVESMLNDRDFEVIKTIPLLCDQIRKQGAELHRVKNIPDGASLYDGCLCGEIAPCDKPCITCEARLAQWDSLVAERDALRQRLRIVLADLFAGKNVDGCIATEDEIVAVRKTLSLRAKERQTASERIAELTELLERVRDLDSLNDLLDLMPTIVKAVGPEPALLTRPPPPTQP